MRRSRFLGDQRHYLTAPPSIGLLLATHLKVFKHSDISETRKKSLYGIKIPTACSWNTKYACGPFVEAEIWSHDAFPSL